MSTPNEILSFWFADSLTDPTGLGPHLERWYGCGTALDQTIARRFGPEIDQAATTALAPWMTTPRGRLAVILLLDQFPRHAFRGLGTAFKYGAQAVSICRAGLASGVDRELHLLEREFFYTPLLHSERLEDQQLSVACFEQLLAEAPRELTPHFREALTIARRYRTIIACFGRFPHRNAQLGRKSLVSERFFLLYLLSRQSLGQIWRLNRDLGQRMLRCFSVKIR